MKTNMILSASGWRKVFAISGQEQDKTSMIGETNLAISIFSAVVFADYVKEQSKKERPVILLGMDARPTGPAICEACVKAFLSKNVALRFIGVTAAPEIMAYSRQTDGFMYISASHNPIGHNGIKFGLSSGGVLNGKENARLVETFNKLCEQDDAESKAFALIKDVKEEEIDKIYKESKRIKEEALEAYKDFLHWTITASDDPYKQDEIFKLLRTAIQSKKLGVVCDMNGSARADSVDSSFFDENGIKFYPINNKAGEIVHEIIPESENLVYVAAEMERLQKSGVKDALLGYMPDCDGDRGNIVYWDENQQKAVILKAQEVFSLSVLAELSYSAWLNKSNPSFKPAVAVNCPTSMRIEEIAKIFGAKVFRAEVGEANVVNLASEKREQGYDVRIFGEGSNGGTITYPSAVRDPLNTIFAIIKLLSLKDLFKYWCENTASFYSEDFSLTDVLNTLPVYTTTGVSEPRAVLHIATKDHAILKARFQNVFLNEWNANKDKFYEKYGILFWECVITNGTKETHKVTDFSLSGKGGLKIKFYDSSDNPVAFIWMRGSGTEPVFRVMCDVKGNNPEMEHELLDFECRMLKLADK